MEPIDYSVVIRTTGKAGAKYEQLLKSITSLEPQPKAVIVVLPEGYALPNERLGWESYYFCQKGMVRQRMAGIEACKTDYALVCDDDISFGADFVRKLHAPIKAGKSCFSAAPLYSFLPDEGLNTVICTVMASAVPTVFHRNRYVSVLKSTGYSYNRHLDRSPGRYYETQSVAWTCFYADIRALKKLELDREMWLDAHGYSALDDQTMFYKAWLMGMKTIVVADAEYEHLDARTSTLNNRPAAVYSASFNRIVFWHRFIYSQTGWLGKVLSCLGLSYYLAWVQIRNRVSVARGRMKMDIYRLSKQGMREARQYIKTEEYSNLPPIVKDGQR